MERLLMAQLAEWKESRFRKPLLLWGARQVGKTWLMKEFGRRYFENTVYVSFYNNSRISALFERDYDPKRILRALEVELSCSIEPGKTLLVFDEVQNSMKVVESLKYFCEEAPEVAVVAAGSLLGVSLHEGLSFPVGKVDELHLYPLNFKEFLLALGEDALAALTDCPEDPDVSLFRERFDEFLRLYLVIGGMPEVVNRYCESRNLDEVRDTQLSIIQQYEGDFGKHCGASTLPRIRMTWNAIPVQLAKENRKFFFAQVAKGARMRDFELAIEWLVDAGLVYKVNKVEKPGMPLKSYVDYTAFKLYVLDVGLLGALSELDCGSVLHGSEVYVEFKGALTEQYVLQELVSTGKYRLYYYSGEKSTYETDFLIQKDGLVIPIEVKPEENLKSKSLKAYVDKFNPGYALRLSKADFTRQKKIVNVPLWTCHGL